jgi:hypothetical protein
MLLVVRHAGGRPCTNGARDNHRSSVEVTMTSNGLASMLLDITLGATILFAVLFVVFEMIRVAGSMQLDGIFSWI